MDSCSRGVICGPKSNLSVVRILFFLLFPSGGHWGASGVVWGSLGYSWKTLGGFGAALGSLLAPSWRILAPD